jgi:hypothetical protein
MLRCEAKRSLILRQAQDEGTHKADAGLRTLGWLQDGGQYRTGGRMLAKYCSVYGVTVFQACPRNFLVISRDRNFVFSLSR